MALENWMNEARQIAAQCWCDTETQDREMDVILAEAVAKRIAAWMDTAAQFERTADFYRNLLDDCAESLGPDAFISDDGSVQDSPIRLKIPHLVREIVARNI